MNTTAVIRLSPGRRFTAVWGTTLLVLAFGTLAYWADVRERQSRLSVIESLRIIETLHVLLTRLVDAETGQRGYLLTGRSAYVGPYRDARSDVQVHLTELRALTRSTPGEQARLDTLAAVIEAKFAEMEETIAIRRAGTLEDALGVVFSDRGMLLMARARALTDAIRSEEMSELAIRDAREAWNSSTLAIILVVGSLLAAGLSLVLNRLMNQYAIRQERIAGELELANEQLREQTIELEMQTDQLQDQSAELQAQNEQLVQLAEELEVRTASAEEANRGKAAFLAAMSHDLRTPLNAIMGYTELLEVEVHGPVNHAQRNALQRVRSSGRSLLTLINDILDFARLESGKLDISVQPVRLDPALRDLEASFLPQLQARGLAYAYEGCDRELMVQADPDRMERILLNLITNAIKFTEPGGTITLRVADLDGVVVQVCDTGIGVPADRLRDIFEPFVQVEGGRTSKDQRGVGLGLAISRELARAMGGELTAESTEGIGSCFALRLQGADILSPAEGDPTAAMVMQP
jgi:signal transduction histidine kinase